jgi:hypothetical protein
MAANIRRPERLQVMLDQDELAALDDWRFKRRMPTRAAAVRELLKRGLRADGFDVAKMGAKSSSFSVVEEKILRAPPPPRGNGTHLAKKA